MSIEIPMGTLVSQYITQLILEKNLIENPDMEECVNPASYELRVGSYRDPQSNTTVNLSKGEGIAVAPGSFILLGSAETVNLPLDILGMLYLRSTFARRGFATWFQGVVDPGYSGTLTFPLHNLTNHILPIYGGERICHIIFEKLPEPAEKPYDGSYQGSQGATPAYNFPTMRIIGQKNSGSNQPTAEILSRTLFDLLNSPELLKRLLY